MTTSCTPNPRVLKHPDVSVIEAFHKKYPSSTVLKFKKKQIEKEKTIQD